MRRPSPAFVISLLALFVALGGTTYAATSLQEEQRRDGSDQERGRDEDEDRQGNARWDARPPRRYRDPQGRRGHREPRESKARLALRVILGRRATRGFRGFRGTKGSKASKGYKVTLGRTRSPTSHPL